MTALVPRPTVARLLRGTCTVAVALLLLHVLAGVAGVAVFFLIARMGVEDHGPSSGADRSPPRLEVVDAAWTWHAGRHARPGAPAADAAGAVVADETGFVVALGHDGAVAWTTPVPAVRRLAPSLDGDLVVVAAGGRVVALDRATGAERWSAPVADEPNAAVIAGSRVVVTGRWGTVRSLDRRTGVAAWVVDVPGTVLAPAAVADGVAVVAWQPATLGEPGSSSSASSGAVAGFDLDAGGERWRVRVAGRGAADPVDGGAIGAPAVVDGPGGPIVLLVDGAATAMAVGLADGRERWRVAVPATSAAGVAPLALADGGGLVSGGGHLTAVTATGRLGWSTATADLLVDGAGGAAVGPVVEGRFAVAVGGASVLMAGPDRPPVVLAGPSGGVEGVAASPGGDLVVTERRLDSSVVTAFRAR